MVQGNFIEHDDARFLSWQPISPFESQLADRSNWRKAPADSGNYCSNTSPACCRPNRVFFVIRENRTAWDECCRPVDVPNQTATRNQIHRTFRTCRRTLQLYCPTDMIKYNNIVVIISNYARFLASFFLVYVYSFILFLFFLWTSFLK